MENSLNNSLYGTAESELGNSYITAIAALGGRRMFYITGDLDSCKR